MGKGTKQMAVLALCFLPVIRSVVLSQEVVSRNSSDGIWTFCKYRFLYALAAFFPPFFKICCNHNTEKELIYKCVGKAKVFNCRWQWKYWYSHFQVGDNQPAAWGVRAVSRMACSGSFCNSVQVQQMLGDALPSREVVELLWLFLFFLRFSSKSFPSNNLSFWKSKCRKRNNHDKTCCGKALCHLFTVCWIKWSEFEAFPYASKVHRAPYAD